MNLVKLIFLQIKYKNINMENENYYREKYLKYKFKYLNLLRGGNPVFFEFKSSIYKNNMGNIYSSPILDYDDKHIKNVIARGYDKEKKKDFFWDLINKFLDDGDIAEDFKNNIRSYLNEGQLSPKMTLGDYYNPIKYIFDSSNKDANEYYERLQTFTTDAQQQRLSFKNTLHENYTISARLQYYSHNVSIG
jgi:hypothetical protein